MAGTIETIFGFIATIGPRYIRGPRRAATLARHQGERRLALGQDKNDTAPVTGAPRSGADADARSASSAASRDRDMGSALRSVYDNTVSEQVPDDLLDLLGKLT